MTKKSKAAELAEYAALRGACAVVNAIPYAAACLMARCAAACLVRCGFKRKRTFERIAGVFPGLAKDEVRRIAEQSLANVLMSGVEMIRAPRLTKKWIARHVADVDEYAGRLREILDEGRGAVIMVPHCGNWYMAAWAMAKCGLPLSAIAARQRNPRLDAWMKRQYGTIDVVERGSASVMRDVISRLKDGSGVAILPDLRVPNPDVEVPFLNGTANVSHGGALFAVATGAPIVVAAMRRVDGRHVFDHLATLRPDPNAADRREEARRLTREAMALLDEAIRKDPGQWFWYNKRWILQPPRRPKPDAGRPAPTRKEDA